MSNNPGPDVDGRVFTYGDPELRTEDPFEESEDAYRFVADPDPELLRRLREGIDDL